MKQIDVRPQDSVHARRSPVILERSEGPVGGKRPFDASPAASGSFTSFKDDTEGPRTRQFRVEHRFTAEGAAA